MSVISVRPGETVTVIGVAAEPQPPLGIWGPTDPRPTNPIAGPGRPPNWGMANDPGYGVPLPPQQPPLVIWGPGDPRPTLPIAGWDPGSGTFPKPQPPLGTWGGAGQPFPTNPIAEPPWGWGGTPPKPELPPTLPDYGPVDWKVIWTPSTGWAVVGIPTGPIPTPSKA
jgi:hypothetical protein